MDLTPAELRHSIRGAFNAMKLCVSAFEMPLEPSEKLEFLSDIETASHRIITLLDAFESADESAGPADRPAPAMGVAVAVPEVR